MAIIRNQFSPFIQPQAASLADQIKKLKQQPTDFQQFFQPQQTSIQQPQQPQDTQSTTADRLQNQFISSLQNTRNLPQPSPVANNVIASTQTNPVANFMATSQVRPNFSDFYNQLQTITQTGQDATSSVQAQALARQQQLFNQIQSFSGVSNDTGVSQGPGPNPGSVNTQANQQLGKQLTAQVGWTGQQWNDFNKLVMMESGWNNTAQNPTSTAFGIGQFLDSTWGGYGFQKTSDPSTQIKAMIKYVSSRYGTPSNALRFHLQNGWY